MRDATGEIQSALILGANSEIARAVVDTLAEGRLRRVILAARDLDTIAPRADAWRTKGLDVTVEAYDATEPDAHRNVLERAGDVDAVIIAFGVLGDPFSLETSTEEIEAIAHVNFTAAVAATARAAEHLQRQGHGSLVVLTSVAGLRVRMENAVYGAAKAGLDGFTSAIADHLAGIGVHVMIVRPGFVHTKMTAGREPVPFSTTPEAVAADIVDGMRHQRRVVWSPRVLRSVFTGLRSLPGPIWRRVSG